MAIATDAFLSLAREAARSQGLPDARIAAIEHPIGGVAESELDARAEAAIDAVLAHLTQC